MSDEIWDALVRIGKEDDMDRTPGWLVRKACEEFIARRREAKRAAKQASEPQQ